MLVEIKLEPVAQNLRLTKVCFMTISNQFFANCLYIFHKTRVRWSF